MEHRKLRVAITHGDINGIGCEVILKTFANITMHDICIPIVYGSPKVMNHHKKTMAIETDFTEITNAKEAQEGTLNVINCCTEEVKVDFGQLSQESGNAALSALQRVVTDYQEGLVDVIVTAPINKEAIHGKEFRFVGHTEYFAHVLGQDTEPLMIMMNECMRVALVTTHVPITAVPAAITSSAIERKLAVFHHSLLQDFCISQPRIAVLALNPHAGEGGVIGDEEEAIIKPAMQKMVAKGIQCFGPYAADGFFGAQMYSHFDGVLAMYHDQGLAPFKALSMSEGVNFTAGLPVIRTSPDHGTAYNIAGQGMADEQSFRAAIYAAKDIWIHRTNMLAAAANPLPKTKREFRESRLPSESRCNE